MPENIICRKGPPMQKLTPKQQAFIKEYLIDTNATQAAIRAGYSEKTAYSIGEENLRKPEIKVKIDEEMAKRAEKIDISAEKVLERLASMVFADTNEIVELRRCCCRYCWGINHEYQLTEKEMSARQAEYDKALEKSIDEGKDYPGEFNPLGGIGYDIWRPPDKDCPECAGQGITKPFFKDTRKLSPGARALYAGVKVTKDGIEVKMHSQDKLIEMLGRHLGMFIDKKEISGPNGGPIETIDKSDSAAVEARVNELIAKRGT